MAAPVHLWFLRVMLALTYGSAKNVAVVVIIALAVLALMMARFMSNVSRKAVTLLFFAGLALGVWTQRQSLQTCADHVRAIPDGRIATCSFFGQDIEITAPTPG